MSAKNVQVIKNVPNYHATDDDYILVFVPFEDGLWREAGHNIKRYNNIIMSDYLSELGLCIPDYTQFMRVMRPDSVIEYRTYGNRCTISYCKRSN